MARDWAFIRYMTAMSRARNVVSDSSSSARRVSALPRPPTRPSTWRAIHSASSSSLYASKRWIFMPPGDLRPELLVLARRVARHDRVGGVEDQLGRAVVALELDDGRLGPVALEVEDVAQVRAAPRVDRLVVIADDAQVVVLLGERPDPQVLRPVRVLVLVHVQVAPALLVLGEHLRRLLEQADGLEQQVVEIERARRAGAAPGSASPGGRSSARGGSRRSRRGTSGRASRSWPGGWRRGPRWAGTPR